MSVNVQASNRPPPDEVLVEIVRYVCHHEITSGEAYDTARHCLQYMVAVPLAFGDLVAEHYEDSFHAAHPILDELRGKIEVEYPIGHRRRRAEGMPVLEKKTCTTCAPGSPSRAASRSAPHRRNHGAVSGPEDAGGDLGQRVHGFAHDQLTQNFFGRKETKKVRKKGFVSSHIFRPLSFLSADMSYHTAYSHSLRDPESFWRTQAGALEWFKFPARILTCDADGVGHWFADGEMNTAYMALDHHVKNGRGEQVALIYDSPVTNTKARFTYRELTDAVAHTAGMLAGLGVGKGDLVLIYMPMIPETVIAMLAVARLGAIHAVVFGGFASPELALRIDDAKPKVILSASCGIEVKRVVEYKPLLDRAIELAAHQPQACVIFQRPQAAARPVAGRDHDWASLLANARPAGCTPVKGSDPLYILHTSGTSGKPKGVVRENGGHAVALKYSMKAIYNADPGDVFWASSDLGWAVGHSYIVYGPLLHGCTTVLYEGKPVMTPDAGALWRVCAEYGVKAIFTAPTAFRAVKKEDPQALQMKNHDLRKLQLIFSAGERLDPPTQAWLAEHSGKPVVDHWWQTESGWPMIASPQGLEPMPGKPGSATVPVPGFDVRILDEHGAEVPRGTQGYIAIKLPLPPSCLNRVWGDDQRFRESYLRRFPGYYASGDGGYMDSDGYVFVMGRVDDVINIAGHRLSTGEIEEVLAAHPAVAECAVIARACEIKGQVPMGLVVLKHGATVNEAELRRQLVDRVRETIGAITCYKDTVIVARLPKTRSGKTLRKTLCSIVNRLEYTVPSTIEDPGVIPEIIKALSRHPSISQPDPPSQPTRSP